MSNGGLNWITNFIWGIADDVIADVVTGKLDVRAIAATLPEVVGDQPIDDGDVEDLDEQGTDAETEEVAA